MSDALKLQMVHNDLASMLAEIADAYPGFPRQTVIIRDPNRPETHVIVTNEPPEIADALNAIVHVAAPAQREGEHE